jgi:hypothetical protein
MDQLETLRVDADGSSRVRRRLGRFSRRVWDLVPESTCRAMLQLRSQLVTREAEARYWFRPRMAGLLRSRRMGGLLVDRCR